MKKLVFIALQFSFFMSVTFAGDIFDPRVFNWKFYLFNNPDLINYFGNNANETNAKIHWQNSGIHEGRQAASSFHSKQYIANYPDIANAFGVSGYYNATQHYLNSGYYPENRTGHAVYDTTGASMNAYRRLTVSNKYLEQYTNWGNPSRVGMSTLYVGLSKNFAGAIDSIYWDGKEFINSSDHGRQMQYAWQYGSYPLTEGSKLTFNGSYIECFNPTEAGADIDGTSYTSSSALNASSLNDNTAYTYSVPSYWDPLSSPYTAAKCGSKPNWPIYGNTNSQDVLLKYVTVSPAYVSQLIKTRSVIYPEQTIRKNLPTRFEAPAIYANAEFNVFHRTDASLNNLTLIPHTQNPLCSDTNGLWTAAQGCEVAEPVIASNGLIGNEGYAIGAIVIPNTVTTAIRYQFYFRDNLNGLQEIVRTRFFGPVVYTADGRATADFTTYIAVGKSPAEVLSKLKHASLTRP